MIFFDSCGEEGPFKLVRLYHSKSYSVDVYEAIPSLIHFTVRSVSDSRWRVVQSVFRVAARARP